MIAQRPSSFNPHAARAQSSIPIYCNGRPVGRVEGQTFRKAVHSSRHFLRQPRAICFDECTLRDAAAAGATRIEVFDLDKRDTYTCELSTLRAHAFPVLRGHGAQVGLCLDFWSVNGAQPLAERRAAETNAERVALQMGLWG